MNVMQDVATSCPAQCAHRRYSSSNCSPSAHARSAGRQPRSAHDLFGQPNVDGDLEAHAGLERFQAQPHRGQRDCGGWQERASELNVQE